ncbi:hypothetical protein KFU94_30800 [Chloroflexi bacterium TSY]|nr:hypothetical protein [Chloroflexi bacterium TSY]
MLNQAISRRFFLMSAGQTLALMTALRYQTPTLFAVSQPTTECVAYGDGLYGAGAYGGCSQPIVDASAQNCHCSRRVFLPFITQEKN